MSELLAELRLQSLNPATAPWMMIPTDDKGMPALEKGRAQKGRTPETIPDMLDEKMTYKLPEFVHAVTENAVLRVNNAVVGAECNQPLLREWLVELAHGCANSQLKAAVTFHMWSSSTEKAHERAIIVGDLGSEVSINVFLNGKMLATGAEDEMTGIAALYDFSEYINSRLRSVLPRPLHLQNIQTHNLHCVLDLRRPMNTYDVRTTTPCTQRREVIGHVFLRTNTRGGPVSLLLHDSGRHVIITSGNQLDSERAAYEVARKLAQYCQY